MFDKKQVCKTAQACVWRHVSHFDLFIYLFVYSLKSQIVWVGWNQRLLFITTWTVNGHDIIISSKLRLSRGVWILNLEWVDIRLPSRTLPPICMSLVCCQNFAFNNRDMEPWLLDHRLFFLLTCSNVESCFYHKVFLLDTQRGGNTALGRCHNGYKGPIGQALYFYCL